MRPIKFRCWFNHRMWYSIPQIIFTSQGVGRVDLNHEEDDFQLFPDTWTGDDDYVLMQYTGIKDKNGKEIYDEDILKMDAGTKEETLCTVNWLNDGFVLIGEGYSGEPLYPQTRDGLFGEVIGNVYDNPELLQSMK